MPRAAVPWVVALTCLAGPPAATAAEPTPLVPDSGGYRQPDRPRHHPPTQKAPAMRWTSRGLLRRLSNERTVTRWAFVARPGTAWALNRRRRRAVRRLSRWTPDGTREVVVLVADLRGWDGSHWVKVRLAMRPNGSTGWVPRSRLGAYRLTRDMLLVDRRRFRATLFRRGRPVWRSRIGVGRSRWQTPRGRFFVRSRLLPLDPGGLYGVFAFGTSAYSDVLTDWPRGGMVGIHGTDQPELIPGRISHGCIRVPNRNISRLRGLMTLGTPVRIR